MEYAHEKAEAVVKALTTESSDTEIVEALASYLLVGKVPPITMSINHNAKAAPCPLRIDRPGAKSSSVTITSTAAARSWVIEALLRGYEVQVGTRRGQEIRSLANEKRSIAYRKEMAEYHARRAADPSLDDDIPF